MNVLKLGRKALTVSTVFSTILWSVGVTALVPAMVQAETCPTFKSGDLLKVSGHPAIYAVDSNGKVLYFPSGDEFKSWNVDNKYSGYTTVSQACYDALPVPSSAPYGVGFRPGSAVVKRPSSDQLYVVEPGNMLAKISLEAAKALYGSSFKTMTVADVFWPNYSATRGADVTEAKAHPGMLVSNGGKTWLVSADSKLREVGSAAMVANRFKASMVRALPDSAIAGLTVGAAVDASDASSLSDRTQTGGGSAAVTTPVSGGALSVALASDNPGANILASGTAFNKVLKLALTAGSADVSVTGLTLQKSGYAANTAISGVSVVDASGVRHGNVASSLTADNTVALLFSSTPVVVKANSSQVLTILVNLGATATAGTLQFGLASAAGVTANGTVSGGFPVTGNVFTLQSGANAVASVTLDESPVNATGASLNVDSTNEQDIAKFVVAETSSKEDVNLSSLTLYNNGTAADTDVQDVQLVSQAGVVLATAQQLSKTVVFNLSASPYLMAKGTSKTFTVRAKIVNGAARTIQFTVYNNYDLVVTGVTTGASVLPTAAGTNDTTFPIGDTTATYNLITIGSGSLSFNKDATSPSTAISPGQSGIVLAKFFAKPTGEDMELRQINLSVVSSSQVLTGTLTVKVNGASVWSTSGVGFQSVTAQALSTYPVIKAGQNSYITVEGSVLSSITTGGISTTLDIVQVKRLVTNDILDPGVNAATGNTLTVQAGALQVNNMAIPVAQSVVVGASSATLANFEFNAGAVSSGENVKITRVVVTSTLTGAAGMNNIGNLVLYDASGAALATTASTAVNGTTTAFTFVTPLVVPKSGSLVLTLKGDVLAGTGGTMTFSVLGGGVTAVGNDTGNTLTPTSGSGSGQPMTIATSGTLILSAVTGGSAAPASDQNVIIGSLQVPVFAFKMTALNEAVKLTSLKLTASGTLNTVNDLLNLKLYRDTDTVPFATAGQMASSSPTTNTSTVFTWTATDNLLPAPVNPGTPVTIYVKADIGGQNAAVLGNSFRFKIATNTDVGAKGASSGSALANTAISGAPAVSSISYIAPFSVALAADAPTGNQTQAIVAGTQLARIKITNNGTAKVTITGVKFTNSGSGAATTTYALYYSSQNSSDYTGNTASTTMGSVDFSNLAANGGSAFSIDGGASRFVTVSVATLGGTAVSGAIWQLSIASLGDVTYTAAETDLGYDATGDGLISGSTASLNADGKPSLATLTKT